MTKVVGSIKAINHMGGVTVGTSSYIGFIIDQTESGGCVSILFFYWPNVITSYSLPNLSSTVGFGGTRNQ